LLFLPALYVAWFRIKEPRKEPEPRLGPVSPPPPNRATIAMSLPPSGQGRRAA